MESKNTTQDNFINSDMDYIINVISSFLKTDPFINSRQAHIVYARQLCQYFIYEKINNVSLERIAKKFGYKEHSSIIHSRKVIENYIEVNKNKAQQIEKLEKLIDERCDFETGLSKRKIERVFYYLSPQEQSKIYELLESAHWSGYAKGRNDGK